ncbi:MAG: NPCBM/NEW2 domain-containing protein [Pirellulaceae bacterium]|nr:NPCBM/NEW2 domain-containing protein [Pirellulaceae bacterium]
MRTSIAVYSLLAGAIACCGLQLLTPLYAQNNSARRDTLHLANQIIADVTLVDHGEGQWLFQDALGSQIRTSALVRWGRWSGAVDQSAVWMTDGSWLVGSVGLVSSQWLRVDQPWLGAIEVPMSKVRAVVVAPPASMAEWLQWQQRLVDLQGEQDAVWLRNGNRLTGVIRWPEAATGDAAPRLSMHDSVQTVSIDWEEVQAVALSPVLAGQLSEKASGLQIGLDDGSLLKNVQLTRKAGKLELHYALLAKQWIIDEPHFFSHGLTYAARDAVPQVTLLSQAKPVSYRFLPDWELHYELGVHRTVAGLPIVIGRRRESGIIHDGLAMHSSSQVSYRWDGSPGQFLAEVRLAEPFSIGNRHGDAICRVLIARDGKLSEAGATTLTGRTANRLQLEGASNNDNTNQAYLDVDISLAQLVVLVVEKGQFSQWGDQVYWLNPRMVAR